MHRQNGEKRKQVKNILRLTKSKVFSAKMIVIYTKRMSDTGFIVLEVYLEIIDCVKTSAKKFCVGRHFHYCLEILMLGKDQIFVG